MIAINFGLLRMKCSILVDPNIGRDLMELLLNSSKGRQKKVLIRLKSCMVYHAFLFVLREKKTLSFSIFLLPFASTPPPKYPNKNQQTYQPNQTSAHVLRASHTRDIRTLHLLHTTVNTLQYTVHTYLACCALATIGRSLPHRSAVTVVHSTAFV